RSFLWVVSRDSLTSVLLPRRAEIEELARKVYDLLPRSHQRGWRQQATLATAALSDMILGPAAGQLGNQRLLIVGDGALHTIPFAALPVRADGGRVPLLARHEIIVLPSASVLAMLRRSRAVRPAAPALLAVVADPVFHSEDPRLKRRGGPATETEQESLQAADLEQLVRDFGVDRFDRLPHSGEEAAAILALVPAA
ncbi:MAG: CHAT domain-containing protein, partial [bacterium]|nr:CHAT domain-containing protein [bacterium]